MKPGRYLIPWSRVGCLALSILLLLITYRHVDADFTTIRSRLARARPLWIAGALGAFGLSCVLSAIRWQLMLAATGAASGFRAAMRSVFVGHFFNGVLLGPAGGDVAKSAYFSRKHDRDFPRVLASCVLDRAAGGGGSLLYLCIAGILAVAHREALKKVNWSWRAPSLWLLAIPGVLIAAYLVLRRFSVRDSLFGRIGQSLRESVARVRAEPGVLIAGMGLSILAQLSLHAVMMLGLAAVSQGRIDWLAMIWIFPVVSMLTSLPISIAGAGVRDASALFLLGLYGIRSDDALTASTLALLVNLTWALAGGWLLWRSSRGADPARSPLQPDENSAKLP